MNYQKIINAVIDKRQKRSFCDFGYAIGYYIVSELAYTRVELIDAFKKGKLKPGKKNKGDRFLNDMQQKEYENAANEIFEVQKAVRETQRETLKNFVNELIREPRINEHGLEFVAVVDIVAMLEGYLK